MFPSALSFFRSLRASWRYPRRTTVPDTVAGSARLAVPSAVSLRAATAPNVHRNRLGHVRCRDRRRRRARSRRRASSGTGRTNVLGPHLLTTLLLPVLRVDSGLMAGYVSTELLGRRHVSWSTMSSTRSFVRYRRSTHPRSAGFNRSGQIERAQCSNASTRATAGPARCVERPSRWSPF